MVLCQLQKKKTSLMDCYNSEEIGKQIQVVQLEQNLLLLYGQMYTGDEQQCHRDMGRCWGCYRTPGQTHNQDLNRQ